MLKETGGGEAEGAIGACASKIAKNRKMTNEKKSLLLSCSHNAEQPEFGERIIYILNTPNLVSSAGAFIAALRLNPRMSRVCSGSITPSSQSLPLA